MKYQTTNLPVGLWETLKTLAHPGQSIPGVIQELVDIRAKYMEMVASYTDDTPQMGS